MDRQQKGLRDDLLKIYLVLVTSPPDFTEDGSKMVPSRPYDDLDDLPHWSKLKRSPANCLASICHAGLFSCGSPNRTLFVGNNQPWCIKRRPARRKGPIFFRAEHRRGADLCLPLPPPGRVVHWKLPNVIDKKFVRFVVSFPLCTRYVPPVEKTIKNMWCTWWSQVISSDQPHVALYTDPGARTGFPEVGCWGLAVKSQVIFR